MRLFEAIIDANHRAVAGDQTAGLRPAEFADSLPVVALTCMDKRLNPLIPEVLGIPEEDFIWVRNAGNIITNPLSSTMRSLAVACALGGAKEVAIIGHTDCLMGKTTMSELLELLNSVGVSRNVLPENLVEYFGIFASERQNVIKACEIARRSPLIGPRVPVHGLLVDLNTGRLEWLVNGYETLKAAPEKISTVLQKAEQAVSAVESLGKLAVGPVKFAETKLGEVVTTARNLLDKAESFVGSKPVAEEKPQPAPEQPKRPPIPPPIQMRMRVRKGRPSG